jgi:hypothetical protein
MCIKEAANTTIDFKDRDSNSFNKDESNEEFDLDKQAEDYKIV